MSNGLLKIAVLDIRDECLKLAEEQETKKQQKCAQVLLAASGLTMLRSKMRETPVGEDQRGN